MKKVKKIGIFACMLLIASSLSVIDIVGINTREMKEEVDTQVLFNDETVDVPTWEKGNYWIYDINLSYETTGIFANMIFKNMRFEVISVGDERYEKYTLDFDGEVTGSVSHVGVIEGNLKNTVISGKADIRKSDLAIEKLFDVHIEGEIEQQLVTNSFWADLEMKQNDPVISPYDFPIELFEEWTVPKITFSLYPGKGSLFAIPNKLLIEEHNLMCTSKQVVTVKADRYKDAFHVSGIWLQYGFWYSPTAGNIIKAEYQDIQTNESSYWNINELNIELIDTNFKPPSPNPPSNNPPNKPNRPSGSSGKVGTSYSYSSSTTDPDGDQVYYMFDWGDGTNSEWLGPYNSGDECSVSHTWNGQGSYEVKVKAKDEYGLESEWSDSLSISMQKTHQNPFAAILEKLIEWMEQIFGRGVLPGIFNL